MSPKPWLGIDDSGMGLDVLGQLEGSCVKGSLRYEEWSLISPPKKHPFQKGPYGCKGTWRLNGIPCKIV